MVAPESHRPVAPGTCPARVPGDAASGWGRGSVWSHTQASRGCALCPMQIPLPRPSSSFLEIRLHLPAGERTPPSVVWSPGPIRSDFLGHYKHRDLKGNQECVA